MCNKPLSFFHQILFQIPELKWRHTQSKNKNSQKLLFFFKQKNYSLTVTPLHIAILKPAYTKVKAKWPYTENRLLVAISALHLAFQMYQQQKLTGQFHFCLALVSLSESYKTTQQYWVETTKLIMTPGVKMNPSFTLSSLIKGDDVRTTASGENSQCNARRAC